MKIAGIALIGVGVVAGVVGLFGLGGGGEQDPQAAPPPASAEPVPGSEEPAPAPPPSSESPAPDPDSPLTPGAPGTPGSPGYEGPGPAVAPPPPAPVPGGGEASAGGSAAGEGSATAARPAVRIYNNSTIRGLAEKAAGQFRTNGWDVAEVQNYSTGVIPTSTVYYREGSGERAAADEIAKKFGMRVEPRFDGIQDATPGVIVIVTRDFSAA
ncbi:hypothetical protein AFB00_13615 [Pseudonocardia sp. HH130630-07]|nr:hypothetical protein AFB00_13615 [Pseudonocardia sp. HH130630-07]